MKLFAIIVVSVLGVYAKASVIPVNPITPIALPAPPVATSYQVVSRNVNRVLVPHLPSIAHPGYASPWSTYPYKYRLGYGYGYTYDQRYGYGYGYPYATTIW